MSESQLVEKIINYAAESFNKSIKDNKTNRFRSFDFCYLEFYKTIEKQREGVELNEKDFANLALNLGFYLASWGMYRGSSFLSNYSYIVHLEAIKEILDQKYKELFDGNIVNIINSNKNNEDKISKLFNQLYGELVKIYSNIKTNNEQITDTLITKILLGTTGYIPAHDKYIKQALQNTRISNQSISSKNPSLSLIYLAKFYFRHLEKFEEVRKDFKIIDVNGEYTDLVYPQMKVLDMGLWLVGKESN